MINIPFASYIIELQCLDYTNLFLQKIIIIIIMKKKLKPIFKESDNGENSEDSALDKTKKIQQCYRQYLDNLQLKLNIIDKLYQAPIQNKQQCKLILEEWPQETIQKQLNKKGFVEVRNRAYYIGSIINNMLHGYGLLVSPGKFYQGYFQNNLKHGDGMEYSSVGIYIGKFINNKFQGRGVFLWNNDQQIYEGEFLAGMKHGSGRWISPDQSYTGEWRLNKPDGYGILKTDTFKYEGEIRFGLKHGQGVQTFKNGDKYIGTYINGKIDGEGEYIWNKYKCNFKGSFKNGLRHGKGIWVQDGSRYQGEYVNDKKNGMGRFNWPNGDRYVGNYFDDMRHGYGEMYWADGSWYKGEWKNGASNGIGELSEIGHANKKGIFQNNKFMYQEDKKNKYSTQKKVHKYNRSTIEQSGRNRIKTQMKEQQISTNKRNTSKKMKTSLHKLPQLVSKRRQFLQADNISWQNSIELPPIIQKQITEQKQKQSLLAVADLIQWQNLKNIHSLDSSQFIYNQY